MESKARAGLYHTKSEGRKGCRGNQLCMRQGGERRGSREVRRVDRFSGEEMEKQLWPVLNTHPHISAFPLILPGLLPPGLLLRPEASLPFAEGKGLEEASQEIRERIFTNHINYQLRGRG